ncbi:Acylphosphatase [Rhizodiscina lignyota]|uniref:Acylphosphatase n=1 Tax=Rhizodiscina lignyota TaxID=1504668 RepID=A0A9P4IMQ4_9PEZI|nr:Acylphosphatase [Rhizodiscina lignyota]
MSKRISYKVEGEVQGVFFRKFAVEQAKAAGVTGFVKNASDGSVTGEAQGSEDSLKQFVQHLHNGPSAAEVHNVSQSDIQTKSGETGFGQH